MNGEDNRVYWEPAAEALFGPNDYTYSSERKLEKLLGCTLFTDFTQRKASEDFPLTDEMRELCKLLMGPHGWTVLKVYRIQKGLEKCSGFHTLSSNSQ